MPIDASQVKWDEPPKKTSTPEEFASVYGPAAEKVSKTLGVPAGVILGQWGLETGWGKSIIPGTNNLGNIKDFAGGGVQATDNMTGSKDKYRSYDSPDAFADDFASLIQRKYPKAVGAKDPLAFATALKDGGYAEDPRYVDKVVQASRMAGTKQNPVLKAVGGAVEAMLPSAQAATIDPGAVKWDERPQIDPKAVLWDAPAKPEQNEVVRQLGLTARAGVKGALALPGVVSDAATGVVNTGLDAALGKNNGFRFQTVNSALDNIMTGAGVAEPKDATERVVQDVTGAMAGAGGTVAAGKLLQGAAAPVVQRVGQLFASGPGVQTASGVTSAGASGITRESGGGATAQNVAGVVGALVPGVGVAGAAEGTRRLMRGGEAGRQTVNDNIKLFNDTGVGSPSVGQASEARIPRAIESVLSKTPGGAGVMSRAAQQKSDAMAASVNKLADDLAPGGSAINAGEAITSGVQGFRDGFKAIQGRLYQTLDKHIKPDTPLDVANTRAALAKLNEGIPGAPNISEFFKNSKIKGIDAALLADLEAAAAKAQPTGGGGLMNAPKLNPADGRLPYEAIKKLRTLVGNEIADNSLLADVPRSKWTALYAALSDDLGVAAKKAGPQAEQSFQWANQFTKGQLERLEQLSGIVGKDAPEKVFSAAMSGTAEGNTVLKRVVDAIPKENRKELASAVLRRMGRATPGNQNELGDAFSTETFLTNLNRLSPDSRATLFGRLGVPNTENKLLEFAKVASNVREGSKVFANPSGTQAAVSAQSMGLGGAVALMTGNLPVAAIAAGTPLAANSLARRMTNPDAVKWLGRKTELGGDAITAAELNSLARFRGD